MDAVWRALMLVVCLVAAAAGTPLRQAEAAEDIARRVAESDAGESEIEVVDGGVGDDSGETVLDRQAAAHALTDAMPPAPPYRLLSIAPPLPPVVATNRRDYGMTPPERSARRQARLQCFRF